MHLLIDALSVSNLSGRHVLLGHVEQIASALGAHCRISVVTNQLNRDLGANLPIGVQHLPSSASGGLLGRGQWGAFRARKFAALHKVDAVFSPSGMLGIGWRVPQIVLAQNPWPLVPALARGMGRFKSFLQRRAFSIAQREAAQMVYNSSFMRDLYDREFGPPRRPAIVAYQGIDNALFDSATSRGAPIAQRAPMVLSVSVMARHKAVESMVDAFAIVAEKIADSRLILVGSWPESRYRREIEDRVSRFGLGLRVEITGHVDVIQLHRYYAEARVFCLLSRCESFGIPAVEAQAFGTPTVIASGTAAPEVTGAGGVVVAQNDAGATAEAISAILTDDEVAQTLSARAFENAQRFRWSKVSLPLVSAITELARDLDRR